MDKQKFLSLGLLVVAALCWTAGQAVALENPVLSKREKAWERLYQALPDRMKGDPAFQRYMDIYNARQQALSNGSLVPKRNVQSTKQAPQQAVPK